MAAIITNKFRITTWKEQFVESFSESSANVYYLGIGRHKHSQHKQEATAYRGTKHKDASPF